MTFHVLIVLTILAVAPAFGQLLMEGASPGGPIRLLPVDAAVLEGHEVRADLPCTVKPTAPKLEFDLRYHAGYDVSIPLQELAEIGNQLIAVFRIVQEERPEEPVYFTQKWSVPRLEEEAKGKAELHGGFALGEGRYRVEWLIRDRMGRVCSANWQMAVDPRGRDKQVRLRLARGAVAPEASDLFANDPPLTRDGEQSLNVLVFFHVAPQSDGAATMGTTETGALLSILRRVTQEPRIGSYSVIAFNLDQSSVLYRRENAALDFPAMGEALKQLRLGTVEIQKLREKDNEGRFLGRLLMEAIARTRPDAVIFVGSRTGPGFSSLNQPLKDVDAPPCPVFYLNYNPDPVLNPWRDQIGSLVKLWRGSEYTISKPPDLFIAWAEVMSRIASKRSMTGHATLTPVTAGLVPKK